jgi:hypothetical protein
LQDLVDERSKIHLDSVEFTLAYRDGVRKVVDNLGKGLVNLDRGSMTLPRRMTAATGNFCDIGELCTRWVNPTSGLTRIAAASAGLRDAAIRRE